MTQQGQHAPSHLPCPHSPRAASCRGRRRYTQARRLCFAATVWWWSCGSWCSRGRHGGTRTVDGGGRCEPGAGANQRRQGQMERAQG